MAERSNKIYTGFGDKGQTKLLSGETIAKDDLRVDTYGALDELQSHLGMARSLVRQDILGSMLLEIQRKLFVAGAELASTPSALDKLDRRITKEDASALEGRIDELTAVFGISHSFVIPGSSTDSAALHVARSMCRHLERLVVRLNRDAGGYENLIVYLNRLSDLLFVMAWAATVNSAVECAVESLASGKSGGL